MDKDEMSNLLAAHQATFPTLQKQNVRKHTGRKRIRGALEFDRTGRMCWVLGYCDDCNGKVTASREEIELLKLSITKQKKRLSYRILSWLLARYETK